MQLQQGISETKMKEQIGKVTEVLIENISFDGRYYIGRSRNEVPDIDGIIYVIKEDDGELLNEFVETEIIDSKGYDLIAKIINKV